MLVNMSGSFICKSISNVANESFEVAVSNFVFLHLGLKVGTKSLIVNRKVVYGVFSGRVTANGLQLKEVRFWNTMFSTPTILISCRNIVLFFAYIKITNFREATTCRQKTYTSARIFFRCCYKLPATFREKNTNETKCLVTSNVSNRSRIPPVAIWKIARA